MSSVAALSPAQIASRCAALLLISGGIAGCSTDVSRFSDPNANPFAYTNTTTPPAEMTGSVTQAPVGAAPAGQVTSQPLPPYGGGQQQSYPQQSQSQPPYGNALPAPPRRDYRSSAAPAPYTPAAQVSTRPAPASGVHVVVPGDTLISIARRYGKGRGDIARANKLAPDAKVRLGQRLTIPGAGQPAARTASLRTPAAQPSQRGAPERSLAPPPVSSTFKPAPAKVANAPASTRTASAEPTATARIATPAPEAAAEADAPSATGSTPTFRWPARGRVIAGFGPKPNGQQNDGINLSVPEGTSVKAAEDGVVAYAGNELKGYGNLVLVRHAGGYVTAYAHASELTVKRGETIKRGQIIAKAGQTGSVTSPQLHFEIRKGSSPVDPMQYLAGS